MPAALAGLLLVLVTAQGGERLRKTDLVRLLSSVTLAPDELAALIRRNCLSFTPSGRDRADFIALGADAGVLREIDACARRSTSAPKPTEVRAVPGTSPTSPTSSPSVPPRAPRAPLSGVRTGFILGVGQHAAAGTRPSHSLLFEVRDTTGAAVSGQEVRLSVTNGHLGATRVTTDTNGRVQVEVTLGPKVGPVLVNATVGAIERQATLYAEPGAAVQLNVRCADASVENRVTFTPGAAVVLRVTAQDGFANLTTVRGLQVAVGDRGLLRIGFVGGDSLAGLVRVEPRAEGSTSLVLVASGQRRDVSVTIAKPTPAGMAHCP